MTTARHAYMSGEYVPTNEEARRQPGFGKQRTESESPDCRASCLADQAKAFATLRAMLAILGGFTLLELADGSYLVTRWNCCRPLADLRAVAAFLRQVGRAA